MAEINITPLVDVMLVLLVIFMVTAPLMETGIPLQLPNTKAKALARDENPTILSITQDGKTYLGREEVARTALLSRLVAEMSGKAKQEVFIRADGALPYAVVAETMALIKNAGISHIGLVTSLEDKKKNPTAAP